MDQNSHFDVTHVFSGQCLVSSNPDKLLITVLGSCVSACIYDPVTAVGGMNHFLLPTGGDHLPSSHRYRYGDVAMASLVDGLCSRGAQRGQLVAKLYGGRLAKDNSRDPGAQNASFAKNFLRAHGIKVIDSSLGDNVARWVTFQPTTGKVHLKESADFTTFSGVSGDRVNLQQRAV